METQHPRPFEVTVHRPPSAAQCLPGAHPRNQAARWDPTAVGFRRAAGRRPGGRGGGADSEAGPAVAGVAGRGRPQAALAPSERHLGRRAAEAARAWGVGRICRSSPTGSPAAAERNSAELRPMRRNWALTVKHSGKWACRGCTSSSARPRATRRAPHATRLPGPAAAGARWAALTPGQVCTLEPEGNGRRLSQTKAGQPQSKRLPNGVYVVFENRRRQEYHNFKAKLNIILATICIPKGTAG